MQGVMQMTTKLLERKAQVPMPINLNECNADKVKEFLNSFDIVLTDCDGVLWLDNEVIKDSQHTINKLKRDKQRVFFVTNNNSKTRDEYVEKCLRLGFVAKRDDILSAAYIAAEYLKNAKFRKKVYVIGSSGLVKELDHLGIKHSDIGPDVLNCSLEVFIRKKLILDPDIGAVLLGFDQHFSYIKMLKAATYLRNPSCLFLATCNDESFPVSPELLLPGTGCLVKCLETASGRQAIIVGKPSRLMKDAVYSRTHINPHRTLMIGDRSNTDILFGNLYGFQTLLVLTGVTKMSDIEKYCKSTQPLDHKLIPKYCINSLGDLLPYLK